MRWKHESHVDDECRSFLLLDFSQWKSSSSSVSRWRIEWPMSPSSVREMTLKTCSLFEKGQMQAEHVRTSSAGQRVLDSLVLHPIADLRGDAALFRQLRSFIS